MVQAHSLVTCGKKMARDQDPKLIIYSLMGVCLLHVQLAERVLAGAVESVLDDRKLTVARFMEQTERERKRTLGDFLKELRSRTKVEPKFNQKLWRFFRMRNAFVHDFSEIPGWDLSTERGREIAIEYLVELIALALNVTGVFLSLFTVSAREDFGEELVEGNLLMDKIEKLFAPTARKILAGRNRRPERSP